MKRWFWKDDEDSISIKHGKDIWTFSYPLDSIQLGNVIVGDIKTECSKVIDVPLER